MSLSFICEFLEDWVVFWPYFVCLFLAVWFYRRYIASDYTAPRYPGADVPEVTTFNGRELPIENPNTGEFLAMEYGATFDDVKTCVEKARIAQEDWQKTSFAERRSVLMDVMQYVVDHANEIVDISMQETGKDRLSAMGGEILPTCEKLRYMCDHGEEGLLEEERTVPLMLFVKKASVRYFPMGVIGCIVPGNFPFHNAVSHITTAIFGGNACIVKASEFGSLSRRFIQRMYNRILTQRGHSVDLVQVLVGYGDTGKALIDCGVDKVLFIGSPETGKLVMKSCADSLTPVTLELGGKDPLIVFDDCELSQVVEIAMRSVFVNNGQNCIGAERIFVQEGVYERFLEEIVPRVQGLRQGYSKHECVDVGCIG